MRALAERRIAGAGLDVFEHEPQVEPALLAMPNVVLTPHLGSAVDGAAGIHGATWWWTTSWRCSTAGSRPIAGIPEIYALHVEHERSNSESA